MSISPDNLKLINEYLGFPLDADHRFLKVPLKKVPFQLVTKKLADCKNPQQTYDRQIKLFDAVIRLLRTNKGNQDPDNEDLILQKAHKVYHEIVQKMGDRNTQKLRWELASAFLEHREKHLAPKSIRPELGRKHTGSFSSSKLKLAGELDFTKKVATDKPEKPPAEAQVQKTSSMGVESGKRKGHLRKRSSTGELDIPKPKSSSSSILDAVSPRKSKVSALDTLRQNLAQNEEAYKPYIMDFEPDLLRGFQGYWRGDNKEGFEKILEGLKGYPSYKKLDTISKIPLMRLALQTECHRMLCSLPEKTNSWALDLIRQSFKIGFIGEKLSPDDVPKGFTQEQLADAVFVQKYYEEKFAKQTKAFEHVLNGLLSQPPFQQFSSKILEAWQLSLRAITKLDDESAVSCCEAFLQKLLIDKETGVNEEQKKIAAAGKTLARILHCFRQDDYVSATQEIRRFFQKTDYKRVDDDYTYFYSFEADGTVKIDATCTIRCKTPTLSFDMLVTNKLRSHVKNLESSWEARLNFTIVSVVPRDASLVSKKTTIPELLDSTILKPLLQIGIPAEARLASILVESLGDS